eukprot:Blabericola_migrator_1__12875@NODE_83_length_14926_cov_238_210041_g74_i0_p8_GENE_NODE_83_length_14926_cov_238_210041_g74_i0NODE_83_length_14926_cov_238_210041_g74_i0_p8_ORF_typecomplete_len206_score21_01_NODE_83_length_14926_cov_238_210041_g74_i0970810325
MHTVIILVTRSQRCNQLMDSSFQVLSLVVYGDINLAQLGIMRAETHSFFEDRYGSRGALSPQMILDRLTVVEHKGPKVTLVSVLPTRVVPVLLDRRLCPNNASYYMMWNFLRDGVLGRSLPAVSFLYRCPATRSPLGQSLDELEEVDTYSEQIGDGLEEDDDQPSNVEGVLRRASRENPEVGDVIPMTLMRFMMSSTHVRIVPTI